MGVGRGECPEGKIVSSAWTQGVDLHWRVSNSFVATLKICLKSIGKNNYQCKFSKRPWCQAKSRRWSRGGKDSAVALKGLHSANSEQAGKWCNCSSDPDGVIQWKPGAQKSVVEAPAFNGWSKTSSLRTWLFKLKPERKPSTAREGWLAPGGYNNRTKPGDKREVSNREIEKGIILNIRWDNESRQVIRKIDN